jgi:hypothetical protein
MSSIQMGYVMLALLLRRSIYRVGHDSSIGSKSPLPLKMRTRLACSDSICLSV